VRTSVSEHAAAFDAAVDEITHSLGDPTRRGIFLYARGSGNPVTAAEIAESFGIHPNVARHHLDHLAHDGYLTVATRRPPGRSGPGAGRPSKYYTPTGKEVSLSLPVRRYDLLAALLAKTLAHVDPLVAPVVAEQVGFEYGTALAADLDARPGADREAAVRQIAQTMTATGFDMTLDTSGEHLLTHHCPFGPAARDHPEVVCALDRGMVAGMLAALVPEPHLPRTLASQARGARVCVTSLEAREPAAGVAQPGSCP
jgi:predicted ArsR family transcriptional regulator